MEALHSSRTHLEIDLAKIRGNFARIAAAVQPLGVMAVLKADAYGLGVQAIARCLKAAGAYGFGVAEIREALAIKDLGLPVQILGGILPEEIPPAVAAGIVCPITDLDTARALSAEAARQQRPVTCHFKIDTGMGRLGILLPDAEATILAAARLPHLNCAGIYSHFPFAYGDFDFSSHQVRAFVQLVERLAAQGVRFAQVHLANSDGIHNIDSSRRAPFTLARTGINLYGCFDLEGRQTVALDEVLTLKSRLVAVRDLPWGASIGYGRTCRLSRPTRVGTVAIGYADGLPLSLSGKGKVRLRGRDCPILGRISMDYTTVALDAVPDARPGDEVICLGDGITVADWAAGKGTITYEIICAIGQRVERRYMNA